MNNSKKVVLSLAAGLIAIGFSAFTAAKKQSLVYYGQTSTNHYDRLPGAPTGTCESDRENACTISYSEANDPGVPSFELNMLSPNPPAGGTESGAKTLYNP